MHIPTKNAHSFLDFAADTLNDESIPWAICMHLLASNLLASLLLTQALLGWCWHCTDDCHRPSDSVIAEQCAACLHGGIDGDEHTCEWQCQGSCVFVKADRTHIDDVASVLPTITLEATLDLPQCPSAALTWLASEDRGGSLPVRLHLLHQLLLI